MRYDMSTTSIPLAQHTRSTDYRVMPRANGWAVERVIWYIDREGNKDAQADDVSLWPTEVEALAEVAGLYSVPARIAVAA